MNRPYSGCRLKDRLPLGTSVSQRHLVAALLAVASVALAAVLLAQPQPVRGAHTYDVALAGLIGNSDIPPESLGLVRAAFRSGWEARGVLNRCDAEGLGDAACADRLRQHLRQRLGR